MGKGDGVKLPEDVHIFPTNGMMLSHKCSSLIEKSKSQSILHYILKMRERFEALQEAIDKWESDHKEAGFM